MDYIKTLILRDYKLCSTWCDFHDEVRFLFRFFKTNGYPEKIIFRVVKNFLYSIFYSKPKVLAPEKLIMYVKFPFLNNNCCNFIKGELGRILRLRYPQINFKFLFVNNKSLQSVLNHKERFPKDLNSGLVYQYLCDACGATYIGKTNRCLRTRIGEHFGRSVRTGGLLVNPAQSAIRDHIVICGSNRSVDNFSCIRSFNNPILLKIYESFEIISKKPNLNQDGSSFPLMLG